MNTALSVASRAVGAIIVMVISAILCHIIIRESEGQEAAPPSDIISYPNKPKMKDIGGLNKAKGDLRKFTVIPLRFPHIFFQASTPKGMRPPQGILLYGPPGTGKTMLARAVAAEAEVPMITMHAAALESKFYGDTPKLLQAAFKQAADIAPCIVFFDEIDGFGRNRTAFDAAHDYQLKCELLRHLDGSDVGYIVIACTNHIDSLDPAIRRRFPREIEVSAPDAYGRLSILKVLTEGDQEARKHIQKVAMNTKGYTGAMLTEAFARANAQRYENMNSIENALTTGSITKPEDLMKHARPLCWEDWKRALAA